MHNTVNRIRLCVIVLNGSDEGMEVLTCGSSGAKSGDASNCSCIISNTADAFPSLSIFRTQVFGWTFSARLRFEHAQFAAAARSYIMAINRQRDGEDAESKHMTFHGQAGNASRSSVSYQRVHTMAPGDQMERSERDGSLLPLRSLTDTRTSAAG